MDSSSFPDAPHDVGRVLGDRYTLLDDRGQGSFATVYRAHDRLLDTHRAVKLLHDRHRRSAEIRRRFVGEATMLARFDHPHIVNVLDIGEDQGQPFFVMPLLTGETLKALIRRQPAATPLHWRPCTQLAIQLLLALEALHERKIVHRDLKPANAIVSSVRRRGSHVWLLDLGLATEIRSDPSAPSPEIGAPGYRAPERWNGEPADPRSDLYSLGAIYYELLTGSPPFVGDDLKRQHREVAPIPPRVRVPRANIPESLEALVLRALAKRSDERHASASAFLIALEAELERLSLQLPPGYHFIPRALAGPDVSANTELPAPAAPKVAPDPVEAPALPKRTETRRGLVAGALGGAALAFAVSAGAYGLSRETDSTGARGSSRESDPAGAYGLSRETDSTGARGSSRESDPAGAYGLSRETEDAVEYSAYDLSREADPAPAPPAVAEPAGGGPDMDEPAPSKLDAAGPEAIRSVLREPAVSAPGRGASDTRGGRGRVQVGSAEAQADAAAIVQAARPGLKSCAGRPASFSIQFRVLGGRARVLEIDEYELDPAVAWQTCVRDLVEALEFGADATVHTRLAL